MLYQNVRPSRLEEVIGNKSVKNALNMILKKANIDRPHTFLFSGPSGCGKTTIARILANELGCDSDSIIELNAANTRGIDTIRDVTSNAQLGSIFSTVKCYIFDESHQLTKAAQQGLLKIIEDCPIHCYFIFCTTEPENLIPTILNRCTKFEVETLSRDELIDVIVQAIASKDLNIPDVSVLKKISEVCNGCPREALNLVEKVIDIEDINIALKLVSDITDTNPDIFNLTKLLILQPKLRQAKWKEILQIFNLLTDEPEKIRIAILKIMLNNLLRTDNEEVARNIGGIISSLSSTVIYGGKTQLAAYIMQICFNN